mmetsp:Transcript_15788/g.23286  ORF Transcript_15788/g.23286 Transcript_15788/m.23286 type:complete len:98 (+) Transcript_15788:838-1131(+)
MTTAEMEKKTNATRTTKGREALSYLNILTRRFHSQITLVAPAKKKTELLPCDMEALLLSISLSNLRQISHSNPLIVIVFELDLPLLIIVPQQQQRRV